MWGEHEMGIVNKGRVHLVRFTGYTLRGSVHPVYPIAPLESVHSH